mgnify:CR=1 FL=1
MTFKESNSLYYNPYAFDKSINEIKELEEKENNKRKNKFISKKRFTIKSILNDCGNLISVIFNLKKTKQLADVLNTDNVKSCGILFIICAIVLLFITYLQTS